MNKLSYKKIQTFNIFLAIFALTASFYFQYVMGMVPCSLCIMQRLCVFLLLIIGGLSFRPRPNIRSIHLSQGLVSCGGLFFSLRQLWLESLPAGTESVCMPGLDILIRYFPWQMVVKKLLWGGGECGEATWYFLGISMAGWCALYFLWMAVTGFFLFKHSRSKTLHAKL